MKTPVIFIVEKNAYHGNLVKYHLQANRFQDVRVFGSAEDCTVAISKGMIPDFIISDTLAGKMDSSGFLRWVKDFNPSIRMIFYSSSGDESLASKLITAGADDYILTTNKGDAGIRELIKNLNFLQKEVF
ncbi:MAG TPA: response regulator [Bacteroidales bacterium]|nr:response regulator [Bacteroidales bacterium]